MPENNYSTWRIGHTCTPTGIIENSKMKKKNAFYTFGVFCAATFSWFVIWSRAQYFATLSSSWNISWSEISPFSSWISRSAIRPYEKKLKIFRKIKTKFSINNRLDFPFLSECPFHYIFLLHHNTFSKYSLSLRKSWFYQISGVVPLGLLETWFEATFLFHDFTRLC